MRTLSIIIETVDKNYDFSEELELIARQLCEGFHSGADSNDEGSYSYEVNG